MPDRLAFLRRPASLSSRVTGLVGIAMMVVFLIFNWISVRSLERHFAEMDEEELGVISSSVIRARAVQLAAALTGTERARPTDSDDQEVQAQALRRLQRVIADPEATSHDLAGALTPLAESCSITLVD